jgi:heterodisulfide reductase subunit E
VIAYKPNLLFYICAAVSLAIFSFGIYLNLRLWRKGKANSLKGQLRADMLIKSFIHEVILQRQILRNGILRWFIHVLIFYGFMGLFALTAFLFLIHHLLDETTLGSYFISGFGRCVIAIWGDLAGVALLLGLVGALFRRVFTDSTYSPTEPADLIAVLLLITVTVSGFMAEGLRLAHGTIYQDEVFYSFFGRMFIPISSFFRLGEDHLEMVLNLHIATSFIFIAYIPYSKLIHILTAPVVIMINASEEAPRKDMYGWS